MKYTALLFLITVINKITFCQQETQSDSSALLEEVTVRAFEQNRNRDKTAASVTFIEFNNGDRNNKTSLVNGFNTMAGVRMEERSPGSYRINSRGSSLRSPFGVRNVKVYWNDIPITDPGGNTYFNQFAWNNFGYIEIFKGPAGSMYGAGTGGLILLQNFERWQPGVSLEYITGSYDLQNILTSARFGKKENKNQLTYAHNQTDGYRIQSSLRRDNFSWISQLKVSDKQQITASVLFTDMYYQTPGALTLAEYNLNPKAARPAAGAFPSAVNARAAIYQKNITAGFTSTYNINSFIKNSTTLYGAFNQVKNPAIRNYERRNEPSFGGRTVLTLQKKRDFQNSLLLTAGSEAQAGWFNTRVTKNRNGDPDTLQTNDDINYVVYNLFIQSDWVINDSWYINSGISWNKTNVSFARLSNYPVINQTRIYRNELAPRISLKKKITNSFSMKATVSRGFSPPTIAELLPSTGIISTNLEAEYGWNYEMTTVYALCKNKLQLEATGFYFRLKNALVQRRDAAGADYFVNAGETRQKGLELTADFRTGLRSTIFDYCNINAALTLNQFRYGNFSRGNENYSGKTIPSVPARTFSWLADIQFKKGVYSNTTYYTASSLFLNDANTASAQAYHLLGWRIGWKKTIHKKYKLNFYTGADNLLNETYSLGNDINAAAGRYYNAAPKRNYYAGIALQWIKQAK
ncbi:MAG TPA: TonB-dependent receptor plug domain-containing protein [Chitinophagaceae bacterium]|nr:TonB-dependent receptor plug domain-containing protein [Chitinophagaceae bacterium]